MGYTSYSSSDRSGLLTDKNTYSSVSRQFRDLLVVSSRLGQSLSEIQKEQTKKTFKQLGIPAPSLANARSCYMPECSCDDCGGYLGTLSHEIDRPEETSFSVNLKNEDCKARDYNLGFTGQKGLVENFRAQFQTITLEPCEAKELQIFVNAKDLKENGKISAALKIASEGCNPQRLDVIVSMREPVDFTPTISISCKRPIKMRRQKWQDHYYCDSRDRTDVDDVQIVVSDSDLKSEFSDGTNR